MVQDKDGIKNLKSFEVSNYKEFPSDNKWLPQSLQTQQSTSLEPYKALSSRYQHYLPVGTAVQRQHLL